MQSLARSDMSRRGCGPARPRGRPRFSQGQPVEDVRGDLSASSGLEDGDRSLELMSANPKTARADDDVSKVMDLMGREQVRRVPIVDDRGSLVGIVAQADIVIEANDDRKAERTVEKISKPGGRHSD